MKLLDLNRHLLTRVSLKVFIDIYKCLLYVHQSVFGSSVNDKWFKEVSTDTGFPEGSNEIEKSEMKKLIHNLVMAIIYWSFSTERWLSKFRANPLIIFPSKGKIILAGYLLRVAFNFHMDWKSYFLSIRPVNVMQTIDHK